MRGPILAGYVAALLLLALPVHADDWPRWRGPRYDGSSLETNLLTNWPKKGPKVLWDSPLTGGYSSLAVADNHLLTMTKEDDEEVVLCLDAGTGKKLWDFRYKADYAAHKTLDKRFHSGPRSTPTIAGSRVLAVGTLGNLHCLDLHSGKCEWHVDLLKESKLDCPAAGYCWSPLVLDDLVYIQIGGKKDNSVAALKIKDGSIAWAALDDPIGYGSPIPCNVDHQTQIVFFTGIAAVGVAPDTGKLIWRYEWKTQFGMNIATPIFQDGRLFLSSDYGKGCALLELKKDDHPKELWKNTSMRNWFASSVILDGYVYGFSSDRLKCVNLQSGKQSWDERGFKLGSLLLADKHLIILGEEGDLALAEANEIKYKEKARWKALEGTCWSVPVLANGTLYVRNEKKLLAVELKKKK